MEILQFADFSPVLLLALIAGIISGRVNRKTWLMIPQTVASVPSAEFIAVAAFIGKAAPIVVIAFTFL